MAVGHEALRALRHTWPATSFLARLSEDDLYDLLRLGFTRSFSDREVLIAEGTGDTDILLILKGFAKVEGHTAAGHTTLLAIRVGGEVVGELAALDGGRRSASVIAAGRVIAQSVDGERFRAHLRQRPHVAADVQTMINAKLRTATRHRIATGSAPVLVRVARVLDVLAVDHGRTISAGCVIGVPLPHADLASLLGVGHQSVERALATLRARSVVLTKYRRVIITDYPELRAIADSADFDQAAIPPTEP